MAIQFARLEYVSRSSGGNSCCKAAYNKRDKIKDERTGVLYSFANRGGNVHHEILLPTGASHKFLEAAYLWNAVECFEGRKNSQLAKELVLALPDDGEVTFVDRVELTRRFVNTFFVEKGLAVQIDIHAPHHVSDKNWHAHLLVTTRRFSEDGETFSRYKARDLDAQIRKGRVTEGEIWGEHWKNLQNTYFEEKGYSIRVDEIGAIAQEHLGPVRMRRHMNEVLQRATLLIQANEEVSKDPNAVINHLSARHSVFEERILDSYLKKNVNEGEREEVKRDVLESPRLLRVYSESGNPERTFYTTHEVRAEEKRILRDAERIHEKNGILVEKRALSEERGSQEEVLTKEQQEAFRYCLQGDKGLKIIEGRAGTGKSYLMQRVREAYQREGVSVMGLAPTHLVAKALEAGGFDRTYTVHSFLFKYQNNRVNVPRGALLMVDEGAMISTSALAELFKIARRHHAQVILFGDSRQLSSIERGGMFSYLKDTFGSYELKEIKRQEVSWQKEVARSLSQGSIREAVKLLDEHQGICWARTKEEAFSQLVEDYSRRELSPQREGEGKGSNFKEGRGDFFDGTGKTYSSLILAHQNVEVDILNQAIHQVRQALGQVDTKEFLIETERGQIGFGVGDRVQFVRTDKSLGLYAGTLGTLIKASKDSFLIKTDQGDQVSFHPSAYQGLRLGYASTIYKGQGKTVKRAYILHSPSMNERLSYVALTRQVKDLNLYVSLKDTKDLNQLERQMGREDFRGCSLEFKTEEEFKKDLALQNATPFQKLFHYTQEEVKGVVYGVLDQLHQNKDFYTLALAEKALSQEVIEQDAKMKWQKEKGYEKAKDPINMDSTQGESVKDGSPERQKVHRGKAERGRTKEAYELPHAHSLPRENLQEAREGSAENSQEAPQEVKKEAALFKELSLGTLPQRYEKQVKLLFKEQIGRDIKNHLPEIKAIALRTAELVSHNLSYQEKNPRILIAKSQYELWRYQEIKENKLKESPDIHWTRHDLEARLLSYVEGNLYLERREGKEKLSEKDFKEIQKEGQQILKDSVSSLKAYQDHYHQKGTTPDQSKFMAQAQLLYETTYNKKLEGQELEKFSKITEEAYQRACGYQQEYEGKVSPKDLTKELHQEIKEVSLYRVHKEVCTLASLSHSMAYTPSQLQEIQKQVQKEFRKEHYKTQEGLERGKEAEAQKENKHQRGPERSRGFER